MSKPATNASLKQQAGLFGLLFAGVGGMIGSGWLFGPLETATQAGPWSMASWLIGGVVVLLIALVFAELATLFPLSGALVHMSDVSHGPLVGFVWGWILILAYIAIAPIEAMAIVSYASAYIPDLTHPTDSVLTAKGFLVSALVLALMVGLNFLMIRTVLAVNSWITVWKVFVPVATAIVLVSYSWHPENFFSHTGSIGTEGIFTAISTGGVFFSLFGFRQALDLAGESSNPQRDVPIAIIGTVLIGTMIYLFLQFGFIAAIDPDMIAQGGWASLHFKGIAGPLAALAAAIGAAWWATILYADAIVSPGACGLVYTTTTSRIVMASAQNHSLPAFFARVNSRGVPWAALLLTYFSGLVLFLPFPSWQKMVGYVSSITVLSYGIGPILLICLRQSLPDVLRPFKLWGARGLVPVAFICANWVMLWAGLATLQFIFGLVLLIVVIHTVHFAWRKQPWSTFGAGHAWWLAPYFAGMWLLAWTAPGELGGHGHVGFVAMMTLSAAFSLGIFYLAIRLAQPAQQMRAAFHEKVGMISGRTEIVD
ncbi:APC family permease [Orrella marina]|uniref:Amino acid permease n=1 Tax=Orrella marina TaxID=2163011 RepID=A0A2R4XFZ4_9BURK|nr:APC family permease [Orrella marina]AWB32732.1 amino acid permease [Orrella marina]